MTEETPKKPRRKRRTKAQIEADKAAKAAAAAEVEKMEAAGYEHVRVRDGHGHFVKDDPSTPENEAWEWVKTEDNGRFSDPSSFAEEEKEVDEMVEEECIPCNEAAAAALAAAEAAIEEEEPAVVDEDPIVDHAGRRLSEIQNRFKARRAKRRMGL